MRNSTLSGVAGPLCVTAFGGDGPPVTLFHGVTRCGLDLAPLAAGLAVHGCVQAIDHRGHGGSCRTPGQYFVRDYVTDAVAVLRDLRAPSVVVGHSLGALAAIGAAAHAPEAVRAVVLLDPPGPAFLANIERTPYHAQWRGVRRLASSGLPTAEVARALARIEVPGPDGTLVRLGSLRDATALRFQAQCVRRLDPETLDAPLAGRWLDGFDLFAAARAVSCPALLLVSDPSVGGMLPGDEAAALADAFADGIRVDLPKVGHLIHWQDAPLALRHLHAFLGSLDPLGA